MSEEQTSSLQQARHLLGDLRQQADGDVKSQLDQLDQLLAVAQRRGEDADAEALRQRMEQLAATNAQFVSVMVHEIRTPITSIKGYSDMLGKGMFGELNDAQQQFVDTIRSNVTRMEHLVSDISDISKIHAGRLRLEPKMDMYKNVAMEVEKNTRDLAAQHQHTLAFETPSGLPVLNLDSTRLAQALTKLVINALQYTPNGGTITVKAEQVDGSLKVSVIDSGIGMTQEEQKHVGELFWRADSELVHSFKGHGLGLPIAIGLVRLLGGEFFFQSEPNKGSAFGFIVPGTS